MRYPHAQLLGARGLVRRLVRFAPGGKRRTARERRNLDGRVTSCPAASVARYSWPAAQSGHPWHHHAVPLAVLLYIVTLLRASDLRRMSGRAKVI